MRQENIHLQLYSSNLKCGLSVSENLLSGGHTGGHNGGHNGGYTGGHAGLYRGPYFTGLSLSGRGSKIPPQ